jgi:hypothetical protein
MTRTPIFTLPVWKLPLALRITAARFSKCFGGKDQNFTSGSQAKPRFVNFDPANWILKTVESNRPKEMLLSQLQER